MDCRKNSKTFGKYFSIILSDKENKSLLIPKGFAHGFCVLSDFADLHYKVSKKYNHEDEAGIIWSDPSINIDWPIENPIVSDRDNKHKSLNEFFN